MLRKYAVLQVLEAWRVPAQAGPDVLSKTAHRVAFDYEPRPGYLYVRSRMISSRTNDNHDTFPADEIEKGYKTFLGKPVFVNHHNANHRRARGVIVAVALHRDRNADGSPDTWVEGLMEVDAVKFPRLCKAILAKRVNRTSMGVDVEWSTCSACGNKATSPAEYCRHLPSMKGKKIRKTNPATGKVEEKLIHEICAGLSFFENSLLVEDPADPTAYVLGDVDARGLGKTAASFTDNPDRCMACGTALTSNRESPGSPGDWRHYGYPGLCMNCAIGPLADKGHMEGTPGKPMPLFPHNKGGYSSRPAMAGDPYAGGNDPQVMRPWQAGDAIRQSQSARTASASGDEPDFRDHITNACIQCGHPVHYARGLEMRGQHPWKHSTPQIDDHDAWPEHPDDHSPSRPQTFGGTHCAMCGDPASINLSALSRPGGGWHHSDGLRRDHEVLPADKWAVYYAIPRSRAQFQQSMNQVRDQLHSQYEQLGGHPLARRPRGDEDQMPPDPFLAAKKREGGDHPFFSAHPVSAANIVESYHGATADEKSLGDRWYSDAHHVAKAIAGGNAALGAGLLSAYSPQTAWPVNMFNASRAAQGDPPGPGTGAMGMQQRSAMRILGGEHHSQVLKAPKTAAFARLIEHGGDTPEEEAAGQHNVVVDRHALSVAVGHRVTKEEGQKAPLDQVQHYDHVAQAYRVAAHVLSQHYGRKISPHQVQAATWLHQIRKNKAEDSSGAKSGGTGRVKMQDNSKTRWEQHHKEHHPGEIHEHNMHYHGRHEATEPLQRTAYGETRVPPQVDTLRMEECPVCGEHDVWSGDRCPVCGFVVPPSLFRDPDTDKAKQVRQQLDQAGEVTTNGDGTMQQAPGTGPDGQIGSGDDADDQLLHPDQVAPDGVPAVQGEGGVPEDTDGQPEDEEDEDELPPGDEDEDEDGEPLDDGAEDPQKQGLDEEAEGDQLVEQGQEEQEQGQEDEAEGQELEQQGQEDQLQPQEPEDDLECPACGSRFAIDGAAQPGVPCPACRMASLVPLEDISGGGLDDEGNPFEDDDEDEDEEGEEGNVGDEPGGPQKEQEKSESDEDEGEEKMAGSSKTAAAIAQAQAHRIAQLTAENEVLTAQLSFLASAAGVDGQLAQIRTQVLRRHADVLNPASPVPDPPQGPPSQTTEQALQSGSYGPAGHSGTPPRGTGHTVDDPSRPGATPGAMVNVPAAQTTTAITPGVEMQTPPATNLIDVTAPVQGTNPSQDGGVPIEQRRIETDVRVNPDPLAAHGPGIGGQGDNGAAFPWMLDARQPQQKAASAGGEQAAANRTFASIRLAKMRITAGLAQGDELAVAASIERDGALPTAMIEHEIGVLSRMPHAQVPQVRPMQRQAAVRQAPSLQSVGAMAQYAPAASYGSDDLDGAEIFI